ncbi:adenosylcobinamide-phosphate synthase CbiB [Gynuella sunshinyii]|uniref:Cobalamin biosynthesis protein CobD n=1 Tax=Gynuella sunshinyii YC6258 TaxID=1445510 RepID=A0A0C5V1L3_9GAMM|nr:adenosylcobinamide-phosphate synthase CbiB [Gynuella sunshinyii]AJQ93435.1 cobalamin biosynthesis protein CobD/CbiB [Gynuella sunshinyii YC6258]
MSLTIVIALLIDQLLGEPRCFHPLVGFGRWVTWVETRLYGTGSSPLRARLTGVLAWMVAVLPIALLAFVLAQWLGMVMDILLLYLAIGRKSLCQHGRWVVDAIRAGDLARVRYQTSMIVSRECAHLDQAGCARATVESVLENGSDSIFAAIFWFLLAGVPGVVVYRLANTLDAMWGYKNDRYRYFGWFSARMDDVLNYVPARLCAVCYCLAGNARAGFASWCRYARLLSSPNGGPVMSAGAGALDVCLGGPAIYHGVTVEKPWYGGTQPADERQILNAIKLLDRALLIFVAAALGLLLPF